MHDSVTVPDPKPKFKSLGVRVLSGAVLMLICGFPVYYGGWAIIALVAVFGCGMIREWITMTDGPKLKLAMLIPMIGLLASLALAGRGEWPWALGVVGLIFSLAILERLFREKSFDRVMWAGMGVLYILIPCLAMVWLRGNIVGVSAAGFCKLVFVILVVIAADSFAYLGGSTLKGPKLAPKISPNKTWSGFLSGLVFGAIVGTLVAYFTDFSLIFGFLLALPIVIASVFGDLLESAIKRHLNVKDAGDLLPGHGGLLDRVDALMMAVVIAALALLVWPDFFSGIWPS